MTATNELIKVVSDMIDGREDLIEGVRKICSLRTRVDPDNEVFLPIRAIESETDHFPIGPIRNNYNPAALAKADEEKARYLADATEDILSACRQILRMYS